MHHCSLNWTHTTHKYYYPPHEIWPANSLIFSKSPCYVWTAEVSSKTLNWTGWRLFVCLRWGIFHLRASWDYFKVT